MEGSLFLLKRQTQPRFRIVILNKKSQGKFSYATIEAVMAACLVALSVRSSAAVCVPTAFSVADNFVEDILGDFKFEIASPYILYRSKSDEVLHLINTPQKHQQLHTHQIHERTTRRLLGSGSTTKTKVQWCPVYCSESQAPTRRSPLQISFQLQ